MNIALKQSFASEIDSKINNVISFFKLSKMERFLSDALENMPNNSPVDYIGELNRNDIMH